MRGISKLTAFLESGIVALAVSFVGAAPLPPHLLQPTSPLPDPLSPAIVAVWEKASAQAGWLELNFQESTGRVCPPDRDTVLRFGEQGKEGEVPALWFKEWRPGVLGRLPLPERGLGLSLMGVTNTRLKELAEMDSLLLLDLRQTPVTDAGLKELAHLKS